MLVGLLAVTWHVELVIGSTAAIAAHCSTLRPAAYVAETKYLS